MTEIQGKSILVRVSEGSSYRESTVLHYEMNEQAKFYPVCIMHVVTVYCLD